MPDISLPTSEKTTIEEYRLISLWSVFQRSTNMTEKACSQVATCLASAASCTPNKMTVHFFLFVGLLLYMLPLKYI